MSQSPKPGTDGLPSHDELDALQAQIDAAAKRAAKDVADKAQDEAADTDGQSGQAQDADAAKEVSPEDALKARIAEMETELAGMKDQALRAMAETENVKKRAEREVKAASKYGIERFGADMLSVSDNLSRALGSINEEARKSLGANAQTLLDGLELTEKDLMAVLARHGIKAVPGKGSKFDPNVHQAVAKIPSSEAKGDVAEVMQAGFTLGERTLRAAMVAVSTGPAKE